jgi:hypothetical protein
MIILILYSIPPNLGNDREIIYLLSYDLTSYLLPTPNPLTFFALFTTNNSYGYTVTKGYSVYEVLVL